MDKQLRPLASTKQLNTKNICSKVNAEDGVVAHNDSLATEEEHAWRSGYVVVAIDDLIPVSSLEAWQRLSYASLDISEKDCP